MFTFRRPRTATHSLTKGQELVEFALVLPVLVLVFFGVFDLGRAFFSYITIINSSREGARYGVLYGIQVTINNTTNTVTFSLKTSDVVAAARQEIVSSRLSTADIQSITASCIPSGNCKPGNEVKVIVVYNFHLIIADILNSSGFQMASSATMLIP